MMQRRDAHLLSVWVYAAVIILVVMTDALEGGAFKLLVTMSAAAAAIQATMLRRARS